MSVKPRYAFCELQEILLYASLTPHGPNTHFIKLFRLKIQTLQAPSFQSYSGVAVFN